MFGLVMRCDLRQKPELKLTMTKKCCVCGHINDLSTIPMIVAGNIAIPSCAICDTPLWLNKNSAISWFKRREKARIIQF